MKFVYRADTFEGATEIKQLLEGSGIPTSISNKRYAQMQLPFYPRHLGIFIYVNSQYNDAVSLINNANHKVSNPIDIQEFYDTLEQPAAKSGVYNAMNNFIIGMIAFGVVCGLLIYALS